MITKLQASEVTGGMTLADGRIVESVYTPLGSSRDLLWIDFRWYPKGRLFSKFLAWDGQTTIYVKS